MSIASKIETLVNNLYPDAIFLLSSEFEADYESFFESGEVLIVLNNKLNETQVIQESASSMIQQRVQISVYIKDEFDTTNKQTNELVNQAKTISKTLYQNIWYFSEVNAQASDKRVTHEPFFKQFNSIRSGVLSLANWSFMESISCAP